MSEETGIHLEWYAADLLVHVEQASDTVLTDLAFYAEGAFKVAARVDTGFYRNSCYGSGPKGSNRGTIWADGTYKNQAGQMVTRRAVPAEPSLPEHTAAVHVAAEYAIYRELEDNTLYNAAQEARTALYDAVSTVSWENR